MNFFTRKTGGKCTKHFAFIFEGVQLCEFGMRAQAMKANGCDGKDFVGVDIEAVCNKVLKAVDTKSLAFVFRRCVGRVHTHEVLCAIERLNAVRRSS